MAEVVESEVVVGNVRSPVWQAGDTAAKEAVVFLHGNPGSSEDWDFVLPRVGELARAVALDMPGYGRADRPGDFDYTVSGYARHLAYALQELGVRRAHLVMHDFGGPWGLQWAVTNPKGVKSVTLIDIGILRGWDWHPVAKIWQTPVLGELFMLGMTRGAYRLGMKRDSPRPLPQEFVDRMYGYMDWGHKRAVLRLYRASKNFDAFMQLAHDELQPLDLPALVLWGSKDPYCPVKYAEEQKQTFPSAEVHVLDGLGHWPFIDDPGAVADLVVRFLQQQLGSSGGRT